MSQTIAAAQEVGGPPGAQPAPVLDARLAIRVTGDVDRRARLAALVRRMPLGLFLDSVLDAALPPLGELADQIRGGSRDER